MMSRAFIAAGSNIDPEKNIRSAVRLLGNHARVVDSSTFYRTEPLGRPDRPFYLNGVIEIETDMPPEKLKRDVLRRIERHLGRVRTPDRYAPRTIDLDLIAYDDIVMHTPELVLPHPDIAARPFVAVPLAELAPDLIFPGSTTSIRDIAASFSRAGMMPLDGFSQELRREISHDRQAAGHEETRTPHS